MVDRKKVMQIMNEYPRRVNIFVDLLFVLTKDRLQEMNHSMCKSHQFIEYTANILLATLLAEENTSEKTLELMIQAEKIIDQVQDGKMPIEESELLILTVNNTVSEVLQKAGVLIPENHEVPEHTVWN